MSDREQTTASPADRFAAIMWGYFIEGCSIDGVDLQEALEKSGLGENRPATAKDIEGKWEGEIDVGDSLTFLTPEGKACVNRGAKESA